MKRVLKGPRELNGSVVLIEGLDGEDLCGGKLREGDTRLFLLGQGASEARTTILASPLRITLPNLDRVEAAVSREYRPRVCLLLVASQGQRLTITSPRTRFAGTLRTSWSFNFKRKAVAIFR